MSKSPMWFKVVAVIALLWNLLGCLAFAFDLNISAEDIAKLPDAQQALYAARPAWALAATATAVIGGALGCVFLLLGKRWAFVVLLLSLIGILIQDYGMFVVANAATLAGPVAVAMQAIVLLVGAGLVLLSRKGIVRGWLT